VLLFPKSPAEAYTPGRGRRQKGRKKMKIESKPSGGDYNHCTLRLSPFLPSFLFKKKRGGWRREFFWRFTHRRANKTKKMRKRKKEK